MQIRQRFSFRRASQNNEQKTRTCKIATEKKKGELRDHEEGPVEVTATR